MRDLIINIAHEHMNRVHVRENFLSSACPFHKGGQERKPSFYISLTNGKWGCSSCGAHGTSIKEFLRRLDIRGTRIEATIAIAEKEAKESKKLNDVKKRRKAKSSFKGTYTLPDSLLGAWDWCPVELVRDGFTEEVLKKFEIGFDRKLDRVTYPLRDIFGTLVGVSGRQPEGVLPKYKFYSGVEIVDGKRFVGELGEMFPEYSSQDVRNHLFGAHHWYQGAYTTTGAQVIVVEGYKADMWVVQHGWDFCCATMGTAVTAQQERLLRRLGAEIWVFMDNDDPGRRASDSLCRRLSRGGSKVYECNYPPNHEGGQPDDLTAEEIEWTLSHATRRN